MFCSQAYGAGNYALVGTMDLAIGREEPGHRYERSILS